MLRLSVLAKAAASRRRPRIGFAGVQQQSAAPPQTASPNPLDPPEDTRTPTTSGHRHHPSVRFASAPKDPHVIASAALEGGGAIRLQPWDSFDGLHPLLHGAVPPSPSACQAASLDLLTRNPSLDVQLIAPPGTGKTLVYVLSILHRIASLLVSKREYDPSTSVRELPRVDAPLALVFAPTSILVRQIAAVFRAVGPVGLDVLEVCAEGPRGLNQQALAARLAASTPAKPHVVVAVPHHLSHFLRRVRPNTGGSRMRVRATILSKSVAGAVTAFTAAGAQTATIHSGELLCLDQVREVVLDEVDAMLVSQQLASLSPRQRAIAEAARATMPVIFRPTDDMTKALRSIQAPFRVTMIGASFIPAPDILQLRGSKPRKTSSPSLTSGDAGTEASKRETNARCSIVVDATPVVDNFEALTGHSAFSSFGGESVLAATALSRYTAYLVVQATRATLIPRFCAWFKAYQQQYPASGRQLKLVLFAEDEQLRLRARDGLKATSTVSVYHTDNLLREDLRDAGMEEKEEALVASEIQGFQNNPGPSVLICSDVCARGMDFYNVGVISLDIPVSPVTWLHRVGRTGRLSSFLPCVQEEDSTSYERSAPNIREIPDQPSSALPNCDAAAEGSGELAPSLCHRKDCTFHVKNFFAVTFYTDSAPQFSLKQILYATKAHADQFLDSKEELPQVPLQDLLMLDTSQEVLKLACDPYSSTLEEIFLPYGHTLAQSMVHEVKCAADTVPASPLSIALEFGMHKPEYSDMLD